MSSSKANEQNLSNKEEAFRRIVSAEEIEEIDYEHSSHEYDMTPDAAMDPEQKTKLEEYWRSELAKTEEEIQTLRQVLSSKVKHSQELKRKLGITVWRELQQDLGQGVKNIQETTASGLGSSLGYFTAPAYQKTSEVVKGVGERTTNVFSSLGDTFRSKLGEVKNSNTFKSFEEKVGSTVSNVRSKMSGSRSNSINSFDESLNAERKDSATNITGQTIQE